MSKVFNMVGGGGGKNISSIIITGLSSTDIVTCTKDGKSYTATWDATAKHWEIVGLPLGTFTVTATNGAKTTTETVLIDIAGVYKIEISFILWLYRDGNECEYETGGWSASDYAWTGSGVAIASGTKENDNLHLKGASSSFVIFGTNSPIDVTKYEKLYADINVVSTMGSDWGHNFRITTSKEFVSTAVKLWTSSNLGSCRVEIDISDLVGNHYVVASVSGSSLYEMKVYKIWLE